jgi:hypothetical protein
MSDERDLNREHLQMLADNRARVTRAAKTGTIREVTNIHGTSAYYSPAAELAAKRIERSKPKDILEVLAENPSLQAENHNRHQEESDRAIRESYRIERQLEAERAAGEKL